MSELQPPWALQQLATHNANVSRDGLFLENGGAEGVLAPSGLGTMVVTQRGAGANMSVDVAAGIVSVAGDENNVQGLYHCVNDATKNVIIAAADPTNPRRDMIVARVQDAFYSGAVNSWSLAVVQGTPAASPVDPAMPNNAVCLARVAVGASVSSITNANITDLRPYAPLGVLPVNSARPPGTLYGPFSQEPAFKSVPVAGLPIFEQDTFSLKQYTTATTGFRPPWNMPWGLQAAPAFMSSDSSGITTLADVNPSLTVALPASWPANRRVRVLIHSAFRAVGAASQVTALIREGSTVLGTALLILPANTHVSTVVVQAHITPTAGAHTYKFSASANTLVDVPGAAFQPAQMSIEDLGPSANPA